MIETKLPEGLTLPESNACMTEHKLPVRETGAVFSHIPPFAERLYEMRLKRSLTQRTLPQLVWH